MPGLVDPGSVNSAKVGGLPALENSSAKTDKVVKPPTKRHRSNDSAKTKVANAKPPLQAPAKRTEDPKHDARGSARLEGRNDRSTIPRDSSYIPTPPFSAIT